MNEQEQKVALNQMTYTISDYLGNLVFWEIKLQSSIDDLTQEQMDEFLSHAKLSGQIDKLKQSILVLNMSKHVISNYPKVVLKVVSGLDDYNRRVEKLNAMLKDDFPKKEIQDAIESIKNAYTQEAARMGLLSETLH